MEEIRQAVKGLAAEGASHIKIMASGDGTLGTDPAPATYTVPELACAVGAAHESGLPATAHCRASESMARAIEAGLDCMEHGEFTDRDGARRFDHDLAARLVDSGMYLSPILRANGWDTIVGLRAAREARDLTADEATALPPRSAIHRSRSTLPGVSSAWASPTGSSPARTQGASISRSATSTIAWSGRSRLA